MMTNLELLQYDRSQWRHRDRAWKEGLYDRYRRAERGIAEELTARMKEANAKLVDPNTAKNGLTGYWIIQKENITLEAREAKALIKDRRAEWIIEAKRWRLEDQVNGVNRRPKKKRKLLHTVMDLIIAQRIGHHLFKS